MKKSSLLVAVILVAVLLSTCILMACNGEKETPTISNYEFTSKYYDGKPIQAPAITTNSDSGTISISYKLDGQDDSQYTNTAPSAIGKYNARISVSEGKKFAATSVVTSFEITDAPSTMIMYVNPAVEFTVKSDGTVLAVNGLNDDGFYMKSVLLDDEIVGKSLADAVTLAITDLKEEGFLVNGNSMDLLSSNSTLASQAKSFAQDALADIGFSLTINDSELTDTQIKTFAKQRLAEFTDEEINGMDEALIRSKLADLAQDTQEINSLQLQDLYYVERARALLVGKLTAISNAVNNSTNTIISLAKGAINLAINKATEAINTAFNTVKTQYANLYLKADSTYNTLKAAYQMVKFVAADIKENGISQYAALLPEKYSSKLAAVETAISTMEAARYTAVESLTSAVSTCQGAVSKLVTDYVTPYLGEDVDEDDWDTDIFDDFIEEYGDFNQEFGEDVVDSDDYYGEIQNILNFDSKTYVIKKQTIDDNDFWYCFEYDGIYTTATELEGKEYANHAVCFLNDAKPNTITALFMHAITFDLNTNAIAKPEGTLLYSFIFSGTTFFFTNDHIYYQVEGEFTSFEEGKTHSYCSVGEWSLITKGGVDFIVAYEMEYAKINSDSSITVLLD